VTFVAFCPFSMRSNNDLKMLHFLTRRYTDWLILAVCLPRSTGSSALSARKTAGTTDLHLLVVLSASVLLDSVVVSRLSYSIGLPSTKEICRLGIGSMIRQHLVIYNGPSNNRSYGLEV
jgi:hypothetical protein